MSQRWIRDYDCNLGLCDAFSVGLWGVLYGLEYVGNVKCQVMVVEVDNLGIC